MLLVVGDIALELGHGTFVHNPDLLRDLCDQAQVVANHHHGAFKLVDGVRKGVDGLDIQVVRRLIQQQHVGVLEGHPGKNTAGLEAIGKDVHRCHLHLAADAKPTKHRAERDRVIVPLILLDHPFQWRQVHVDLINKVLVEARHGAVCVLGDVALSGLELAADELGERGFTRTIGTDKAHTAIKIETQVQSLEERWSTRISKGDIGEL